jgi:hypothetical protein
VLLALRPLYTASLGITQPGGAGTTIYIYDDNFSGTGSGYTFQEIAIAFPADFQELGTGNRSYRSLVDVQVGDAGTGTATTTLIDADSSVSFDSGKSLRFRATQTTSWRLILGEKVGSGNQATGKRGCAMFFKNVTVTWRGMVQLYGCTVANTAGGTVSFQVVNLTTGNGSELVNCILSGWNVYTFGTSTGSIDNLYNLDLTGNSASSQITSIFAVAAERMTVGGNPVNAYIGLATASIQFKDTIFFGTPGIADLRWTNSAATNWTMVRPGWSLSGQPKVAGPGPTAAASGAHEYWLASGKVVDPSGANVASIPWRLKDQFGTYLVDTTTDSNGEISFGSLLTANAVIVADWYNDGAGNPLIRHRSPFTLEVNMGVGANPAYKGSSIVFNWPGKDTVTTAAGTFKDLDTVTTLYPVEGPIADFCANATGGDAPLTVNFMDESDPGDDTITNWDWTFGDGGVSTSQNPTYVYSTPGTYTVSLTVTTAIGTDLLVRTGFVVAEYPSGPPTPYVPPTVPMESETVRRISAEVPTIL